MLDKHRHVTSVCLIENDTFSSRISMTIDLWTGITQSRHWCQTRIESDKTRGLVPCNWPKLLPSQLEHIRKSTPCQVWRHVFSPKELLISKLRLYILPNCFRSLTENVSMALCGKKQPEKPWRRFDNSKSLSLTYVVLGPSAFLFRIFQKHFLCVCFPCS